MREEQKEVKMRVAPIDCHEKNGIEFRALTFLERKTERNGMQEHGFLDNAISRLRSIFEEERRSKFINRQSREWHKTHF